MSVFTTVRAVTRPQAKVPDFDGDPYKVYEWLKYQIRINKCEWLAFGLAHRRGDSRDQTIAKVMELSHALGLKVKIDQFC